MTNEYFAQLMGIIISLFFSFFPGVKNWFYGTLDSRYRPLVMLGAVIVSGLAMYGLSCVNVTSAFTCDSKGLNDLVKMVFWMISANQITYLLTQGEVDKFKARLESEKLAEKFQ